MYSPPRLRSTIVECPPVDRKLGRERAHILRRDRAREGLHVSGREQLNVICSSSDFKGDCCFDITKSMNSRSTLASEETPHVRHLFEPKTRSFGRSERLCDPPGTGRQLEAKEAGGSFRERRHSSGRTTAWLPPASFDLKSVEGGS